MITANGGLAWAGSSRVNPFPKQQGHPLYKTQTSSSDFEVTTSMHINRIPHQHAIHKIRMNE